MKMNIKPALRYQTVDLLKSCLAFSLTIVVITLFIPLLRLALSDTGGTVVFGGYAIIASIFLFVVGIVAPRSYLRLNMQMGVSRSTSFITQLISVLIAAAAASAIGAVVSGIVQAVFINSDDMFFMDLYQMIYNNGEPMGVAGFFMSFLFDTCIGVCAYICGMFFTLLFWRLNKFWTIVVAIGMFLFLNVGLSVIIAEFGSALSSMFRSYFEAVVRGPAALMLTFLAVSAFFGIIEWLLLRRAYIKASVG